MFVTGKRFYVEELKKDITVDGLIERYDESNNFMLSKIIEVGEELQSDIKYQNKDNIVLLTSRIDKVPFKGGFFVPETAVLAILSKEEYEAL